VNFPYKLCKYDHLSHLRPKIEQSSRILSQPPIVLTNMFPHNPHMDSETSDTGNASNGSQNPLPHEGGHLCINMAKSNIDVSTQSHDYSSSQTFIAPKSPPPPKTPLEIKNPKPMSHILKEY
jgi:hypothetical protein